ncbi:MAG: HEAT repeat domain-containing protein [Deltaproteobacteria bacterium]|nr:HEAT repeat domain-containing protein [Deltaproteobacteria bacterium]
MARNFFKSLEKCHRVYRIYGGDHDLRTRQLDEASKALDEAIHLLTEVRVQVAPDAFFLYGAEVYKSTDERDLPAILYSAGARELVFRERAVRRELIALLESLSIDASGQHSYEDDCVTIFWRSRPRHVQLHTTIRFSDLSSEGETAQERYDGLIEALRMPRVEGGPELPVAISALQPVHLQSLREDHLLGNDDDQARWLLSTEAATNLQIDAIELRSLNQAAEDALGMLRRYAEVQFRVLATCGPDREEDAERIMASMVSQLRALIMSSHPRTVIEILQLLTNVASDRSIDFQRDPMRTGQELLISIWDEEVTAALVRLSAHPRVQMQHVTALLRQLPAEHLHAALLALPAEADEDRRTAVMNALAKQIDEKLDDLPGMLLELAEHAIIDFVGFARRSDDPRVQQSLEVVIDHPSLLVRQHILDLTTTLAAKDVETSRRLAVPMMYSSDPRLRIRALDALLQQPDRSVSRHIQDVIESMVFKERNPAERKRYYEALGRCGGAQAIHFLGKILGHRGGLLTGKEHDSVRVWAASGLGMTRSPSALKPLQQAATDRRNSQQVRNAARRAAAELSQSMEQRQP